jgi:hypothetical protein
MTLRDRGTALAGAITFLLAGLLCVGPWSAPARAADTDEASARVLFVEARRLAAAGDYAGACPKFEDSFRLNPGIGTNFNLADCFEHTGRIASAWARFLDVAAATKLAGQPEREQVARQRAAALESRLAHLVLAVAAPAPGLVVERDQVTVPPSSWGVALPIDPGVHTIKVTAPGKRSWSTEVRVPEGDPANLSLTVPPLAALPAPPPPLVALAASSPPRSPQRHVSAPIAVVGAIGLVGMVAGVYFGVEFQRANSEARGLCGPLECATKPELDRHQALLTEASRDRTWAFIGAGVGAAALATAGYLWWRSGKAGPPKNEAATTSARSRVGAQGLGGAFTVEW